MLVNVVFSSFAVDPGTNAPLIILREKSGIRTVSVPVGPLEASALALETLKVTPVQPLTIDMVVRILERLNGTVARAVILLSSGQRLDARLDVAAGGTMHQFECRPCDAITLALRSRSPLFVREEVFEQFSGNDGLSSEEKLRAHLASLDTLTFGTVYLE